MRGYFNKGAHLSDSTQNLRTAFRQLSAHQAYGIIAVFVFALGITGSAALLRPGAEEHPVTPGVGANTEDPRKVLRAADEALRAVQSVSYDAAYQGTGAFATRTWTATGKVRIARLAAGDPLMAKLAAEGQNISAGTDQVRPFHVAFDGQTIRKLEPKDSTLIEKAIDTSPKERKLGTVTGFFGGGAYSLLMFEYVRFSHLTRQAEATMAEYEGRTSVGGVFCHVVYVEYDLPDGRVTRERWLIGIKDSLPRQCETVSVDDKGRYGAYVLTLSNVRVNSLPGDLAFTIKSPDGYKVKPYVPTSSPPFLVVGDSAPDWKLADAEGRTHALTDHRGRLVVLDFWATWCGPCVREMPDLQELHEKYRKRGVEIIGINAWENSNAAAYMKEKAYTFGLLLKGEAVAEAYHVETLPTIYVIGADGKIICRDVGLHAENLAAIIEQELKQLGK